MKRAFILLAIALQLLVPGWMAVERELIVQNGQRIQLRTAPIDPRDIFRGDFVRLDYEISTLGAQQLSTDLREQGVAKGEILYTQLQIGSDGLARATGAGREPAAQGIALRARAPEAWKDPKGKRLLRLRYGIEKYFVEQGKGRAMEKKRGQRSGIQVPLLMEVAVGGSGKGVITAHRWSQLGSGLQVLRSGTRNRNEGNRNALLQYSLHNASDSPLSLAMTANLCSFHLLPVKNAALDLRPERSQCESAEAGKGQLIRLAPGESHQVRIDLDAPRWRVLYKGASVGIGTLEWNQRYRILYRAPQISVPPGQTPVWQGELPSRAFHGRGQID